MTADKRTFRQIFLQHSQEAEDRRFIIKIRRHTGLKMSDMRGLPSEPPSESDTRLGQDWKRELHSRVFKRAER